jgi:hypothetical protein
VPTTIRQIQDDIINPEVRLADILRKATVLSYRLNVPEFKQWVDHELDGYDGEGVEVPDYRTANAISRGNFRGIGGASIVNYQIPTLNLPEQVQEIVNCVRIWYSVAALESMARKNEEFSYVPWSPDVVAAMSGVGRIIRGYALVSAHQPVSRSAIEGILDTVRNRLLTFMLELEEQFPDLAESEDAAKDVPKEQATHIFNTYVHGGQNVIASGQEITQHAIFPPPNLPPGDLEALLDYVRELNVPEEDVSELREALEEDEAPSVPGRLGNS